MRDWLLLVVPGVIWGASFLFTAIVAAALARRAPSPGVVAGLAVGLTGAVLVVCSEEPFAWRAPG